MELTEDQLKFLEIVRQADAVFVHYDDGLRFFSYIRGLSDAPAKVEVKYGKGPDGKRHVRHLTVRMGLSEREYRDAVAICRAAERPETALESTQGPDLDYQHPGNV